MLYEFMYHNLPAYDRLYAIDTIVRRAKVNKLDLVPDGGTVR